jgi:hypothetical protein
MKYAVIMRIKMIEKCTNCRHYLYIKNNDDNYFCDEVGYFRKNELYTYCSKWQRMTDYQWKKYKKKFLEKHPLCPICNWQPSHDIHHVDSVGSCPEKRLDPENHAPICRICHDQWHRLSAIKVRWDAEWWETHKR